MSVCARSCTHIYDVRKRKGVVIYLNVNNNNDIQNNDIYAGAYRPVQYI